MAANLARYPVALLCVALSLLAAAEANSSKQFPLVPRVNLTSSGPETSAIGWGTLHAAELPGTAAVVEHLRGLLSLGITLLDLADVYGGGGSNELIGQAFRADPSLRPQFELICKFNNRDAGFQYVDSTRAYILERVEYYNLVLGTDFLDVLMFHSPDALMDADVVAHTFEELKAEGRVGYFGVSNYAEQKYRRLDAKFAARGMHLVGLQAELSVLTASPVYDGRLDMLDEKGHALFAWGPLGGDPYGIANRLFINNDGAQQQRILRALDEVRLEIGAQSLDQVAVKWILKLPGTIIPLLGSTRIDRVARQSVEALAIDMTDSQWTWITAASATDCYERWEQLHGGRWHDIVNDYQPHAYGTPFGVDVPPGFTDYHGDCADGWRA